MAFENKLIVITGGAGGIARETATLLLAEGAELLLIDPSATVLEASAAALAPGDRVRTAVSALESPEACAAALAGIEGRIHALVHLAGIFRPDALDPGTVRFGMRPWRRLSPTPSTWRPRSGRSSTPRRPVGWCS